MRLWKRGKGELTHSIELLELVMYRIYVGGEGSEWERDAERYLWRKNDYVGSTRDLFIEPNNTGGVVGRSKLPAPSGPP